jgi:AcrR family transcriptional regulator
VPSDAASLPAGEAPARSSDERREDILRAGLDLFALSGFHGTSVRQIARAVGVNEATLYHYFPSKDAILQAVFDRVLEERRTTFAAWVEREGTEGTLAEILLRLGRGFLVQAVTPLELKVTRLMLSEGPRLSAEGRQAFERVHRASMQPAIDLFQRLMEQGRVGSLDPERVTMTFFAPLILWKICHAMGKMGTDGDESERVLAHQVEMLARALRP